MRRNKPRKSRISQLDLNGKEKKLEMLTQSSTRRSRSAKSISSSLHVLVSISCSSLSSCDLDLVFFPLSISPVLSSLDHLFSLSLSLSICLLSRIVLNLSLTPILFKDNNDSLKSASY
ncbi:hypothetical protein CsSME_00037986 [Camellia sinensis var. sinensis]